MSATTEECLQVVIQDQSRRLAERDRQLLTLREALMNMTSAGLSQIGPDRGNVAACAAQARFVLDSTTAAAEQAEARIRKQATKSLRCRVTDNLCGTDTWMVGSPCQCNSCQAWLRACADTEEKKSAT